jgi:hypothetical protein
VPVPLDPKASVRDVLQAMNSAADLTGSAAHHDDERRGGDQSDGRELLREVQAIAERRADELAQRREPEGMPVGRGPGLNSVSINPLAPRLSTTTCCLRYPPAAR